MDEPTDPLSGLEQRNVPRRDFLRMAGAVAATPFLGGFLAACSKAASSTVGPKSSGANGKPIKIGFIALTDATSVIMASALGYFAERGLNVEVVKQASWPVTRDNLLSGQIDAAHCLFSMPASLAAGIGGTPDQLLNIAMVLNNNGQAITLKKDWSSVGYGDIAAMKAAAGKLRGSTFAMTFPGGTHDTWMRYWLNAAGITGKDAKIIPIPPPQMVANMKVGNMDGFCVGEPWPNQAVHDGVGFTTIATQDIWEHHPEKALVVNPAFASARRDDLKAVMGAILKASKWLEDAGNLPKAAAVVGVPGYIGTTADVILPRMQGVYDLGAGLGQRTFTETRMRFFRDGQVNFPRKSHLMWFLAQYKRLGYLTHDAAYADIANRVILTDLYKEVAAAEGVAVPDDDLAPFHVKLDDTEFDPAAPEKEAARA